jgi:hypothetical protein
MLPTRVLTGQHNISSAGWGASRALRLGYASQYAIDPAVAIDYPTSACSVARIAAEQHLEPTAVMPSNRQLYLSHCGH